MKTYPNELDLKRRKKNRLRRALTLVTFILTLSTMLAVSAFADEATPVTALAESGGMGGLIEEIFSSFSTVIEGLSSGLKDAFGNLIYVDPAATDPTFSPLILFLFTMAGVALASGILYKIFGLVKSHRRG